MAYTVNINGKDRVLDVPGEMPLLWALRNDLGLVGTKFGCGAGLCGACTVHVDGTAQRSCSVQVSTLAGKKVCTVQGSTSLTNVQKSSPQADVSITFDKYSLCIEALKDGRVEAVTTDNVILLGFINDDPANLKLVNKPFTTEPYGIGVKKDDAAFRTFVNDTLEKAYKDGSWKKAWDDTAGKTGQAAPTPPAVNRY